MDSVRYKGSTWFIRPILSAARGKSIAFAQRWNNSSLISAMSGWPRAPLEHDWCFSQADNKTWWILLREYQTQASPPSWPQPSQSQTIQRNKAEISSRSPRPLTWSHIRLSNKASFMLSRLLDFSATGLRIKSRVNMQPQRLCPWNAFSPSEITTGQWDGGSRVRH